MKVPIFSTAAEKVSEIELPVQFSEPVRLDLIKRAALAVLSSLRQAYGADPEAGRRQGKALPKFRRKYGTTYGKGISRVARKIMWHRGEQFGWVGARGAQTVKGLSAFAPKSDRMLAEKINKKENRKAIRSALSASTVLDLVKVRHKVDGVKFLPLVLEDSAEKMNKAREVFTLLGKLGLGEELSRTSERKIRAGRGKTRGRKYKKKSGPLVIVSKSCDLEKAARNIPGVSVVQVKSLNAALLAPGASAGRLTVWTKPALELLGKEKLFT
ncbi:MAG TPA: 50S ribosomal protein L4 [Candidatus Nanoarchaeia archaeon]|nr:50S ribosomal protein L4 [Candidatus Nanoarchaeia archaeon]